MGGALRPALPLVQLPAARRRGADADSARDPQGGRQHPRPPARPLAGGAATAAGGAGVYVVRLRAACCGVAHRRPGAIYI